MPRSQLCPGDRCEVDSRIVLLPSTGRPLLVKDVAGRREEDLVESVRQDDLLRSARRAMIKVEIRTDEGARLGRSEAGDDGLKGPKAVIRRQVDSHEPEDLPRDRVSTSTLECSAGDQDLMMHRLELSGEDDSHATRRRVNDRGLSDDMARREEIGPGARGARVPVGFLKKDRAPSHQGVFNEAFCWPGCSWSARP